MTIPTDTMKEAAVINLTAMDRCDRCGAQAYHLARKSGGLEILLCNHHHREHGPRMLEEYWTIESDKMQGDPQVVSALSD